MTAYKQTELGLIPSDWEVVELGDICTLKSGQTITAKKIHDLPFGYPCYGGNGLRGYTNSYTHDGEFSLIGRQGALCGNIVYVKGKFFASEHALVVTQQDNVNAKWLSIYLEKMNLNQHSESSAQPGLSAEKLKLLNLIFPKSKPEQTAIATALSDTDALITELEKLLAKKQAIKTATMQQLLTGKTRLPEFAHRADGTPKGSLKTEWGDIPEDWEVMELGRFCNVQGGFSFKSENFLTSGIPVIRIGDIQNGKINLLNTVFWSLENNIPNQFSICFNDAVIAMSGATIGKIGIYQSHYPALINQRVGKFIIKKPEISKDFVNQFISSGIYQNSLLRLLEQGAQPNISSKQLESIFVFLPMNKTEQTAIAQILGDMDSEITALQARIEKLREIKQGMMQNLLTGKIRLPF